MGHAWARRSRPAVLSALAVAALCGFQAAILARIFAEGAPWGSDLSLHYAEALGLAEALRAGDVHLWNDSANLGFPSGYYYQPLPQLIAAVLELLSFGAVPFVTLFKGTIVLPMALLPLTIYRALRVTGSPRLVALGAAGAAGMVTSTMTWGHGPDAVLTRGIYTQAWALLFYPLAVAYGARYLATGAGLPAAVGHALLTGLCHPIIAFCLPIALVATPWWRAGWRAALRRSLALVALVVAVSSFLWVPVMAHYDSFGGFPNRSASEYGLAATELWRLLAGGMLLDAGRWPILTVLAGSAVVLGAASRDGLLLALLAQAAAFTALVVAGPTVHLYSAVRFVAPMQLTLAVVAGAAAGAWVRALRRLLPRGRAWAVGALVPAAALLVPLGVTTARHVGARFDRFFDHRASVGDEVRDMARAVAALPDGRLVAAERWGIRHSNHWWYYLPAVDGGKPVLRGYGGASHSSSASYRYLYRHADFDPRRHARLYNVRWLLAHTGRQPKGLGAPVRAETAAHVLLELEGGGWVDPIQLMGRVPTDKAGREAVIRRWLSGTDPSQRRHLLVSGDAEVDRPLAGHVVESQRAPSRYTAEVEVEAGALATFLLKVTYHPGWRVRVDGRPAELLRVSPEMMAVQVGPGRHRLGFEFRRPWWSFALLAGSVLSLGLLVRRERCRAVSA